jgi:hypothetical protein
VDALICASCHEPPWMPLMTVVRASAVILGLTLSLGPVRAQLFNPPRPPGSVPTRQPAQAPQPQAPAPPGQTGPDTQLFSPGTSLGRIQSEDLPPPGSPPGAGAPAGQPAQPGQRQQRAGLPPANSPAPPGPPAPPAQEDVVTLPPAQKIVNPTAVFSGLDKITGRITTFDATIGETVQFGALQVTARACYSRPPTETPLTDGFVEVDEVTLQGEVQRIFTGWMFAASPGLHAVEHPIYDVWLTDCKGGAPPVAEAQPPTPPPARPASSQRQTPQRTRQNPGGTLAQPGGFR